MRKGVVSDLDFAKTIRLGLELTQTNGPLTTVEALYRPKGTPAFAPRRLGHLTENVGDISRRAVLNTSSQPLGRQSQIVEASRYELNGNHSAHVEGGQGYCRIMISPSALSGTRRHCALSSASNCQVSPLFDVRRI